MYINAVASSIIYGYDFYNVIFKIKLHIASVSAPSEEFWLCTCWRDKSLFLSKLSCFLVTELKKDEYTVGRDASCSLVINESHLSKVDINLVSKKQFKISHKKDGVYLEGFALTYVNDKKIDRAEKTILKHNDGIAIGKQHLKGW
jgi:hypothetical protein